MPHQPRLLMSWGWGGGVVVCATVWLRERSAPRCWSTSTPHPDVGALPLQAWCQETQLPGRRRPETSQTTVTTYANITAQSSPGTSDHANKWDRDREKRTSVTGGAYHWNYRRQSCDLIAGGRTATSVE